MTDAEASLTVPLAGVIGSPISHSRSPVIMQAAFAATGIEWGFFAFDFGVGEAAAAVDALRTLGLRGYSVTMPLKVEVMAAVDRVSPTAEVLNAVNCIAWDGDELVGHNTDGSGFVNSLTTAGVRVDQGRAVVLGAGGAARSIIHALASAGSPEVVVVNRSAVRADDAAGLAGEVGRVGTLDDIADARLLVNATSLGMAGTDGVDVLAVPDSRLHDGLTVADIVYNPLRTPLLAAAESRGAVIIDGLGMLVHQAARAFELWTGIQAPIPAMDAAARHTL